MQNFSTKLGNLLKLQTLLYPWTEIQRQLDALRFRFGKLSNEASASNSSGQLRITINHTGVDSLGHYNE
jgi:hypothetical protein